MQIEAEDIDYYLGMIEQRVSSGQNGAVWQRQYIAEHGKDMQAMTRAYLEHQQKGEPVLHGVYRFKC